jgi:hypothetical protein
MFKVIIAGGKYIKDYNFFEKMCVKCLKSKAKEGIFIYSTGDDDNINQFAHKFNIDMRIFVPQPATNPFESLRAVANEMVQTADAAIIFEPDKGDMKPFRWATSKAKIPRRRIWENPYKIETRS